MYPIPNKYQTEKVSKYQELSWNDKSVDSDAWIIAQKRYAIYFAILLLKILESN